MSTVTAAIRDYFVRFVWVVSYLLLWPIIRISYRVEVILDKTIYRSARKPLIIISNHKSLFDPWIVLISLPLPIFLRLLPIKILGTRDFTFKTSKILDKLGLVRIVYYLYDVLCIRKDWTSEQKILPLLQALNKKQTVFIFPEGSIDRRRGVNSFRRGAAYLHSQSGAAILPCSIKFEKGFWRRKCRLNYGAVLTIPPEILNNDADDPHLTLSSEFLHDQVENLYEETWESTKR